MNIRRLYTGADGHSHVEDISLESHPQLTSLMATEGIMFRQTEAGHFMDWHPAPRRQFVIVLAGQMEIGLRDGSLHQFAAGDVLMAEDVTGTGHTRRITGPRPRVAATIPLAG